MIDISLQRMKDLITAASDRKDDLSKLRSLVFDYYYDEDRYEFESPLLETLFRVLLVYLQSEEAFGDDRRTNRFTRLAQVIKLGTFSKEDIVLAMSYEEVMNLFAKYMSNIISEDTLFSQVEKLIDIRSVEAKEIIKLVREEWEKTTS